MRQSRLSLRVTSQPNTQAVTTSTDTNPPKAIHARGSMFMIVTLCTSMIGPRVGEHVHDVVACGQEPGSGPRPPAHIPRSS